MRQIVVRKNYLTHLKTKCKKLRYLSKILLLCHASVITEKYLSFKIKLEEKCKSLLTFSCSCHSAALIAYAACVKIPQYCEEFLKKIVN